MLKVNFTIATNDDDEKVHILFITLYMFMVVPKLSLRLKI